MTTTTTTTAFAKPYRGPAMEGMIARWYARITERDRGYRAIADAIAARVSPGARILEIAPGPGYLAIELARRGFAVSTVDISQTFVQIAKDRARAAGVSIVDRGSPPGGSAAEGRRGSIDVRHGNAAELPFPDDRFSYVVCRAAFKNFSDPVGALDEAHRVLAPGGTVSILDLRKEATPDEVSAEVAAMEMSWLDAWWTRCTFRWFLLPRAYARGALEQLVAQSRFARGEIHRDGIGFDLRLSKP